MTTSLSSSREVTDREYRQIVEFLYHEAQLLDARQLDAWLELLSDDIEYRVFAPTVASAGASHLPSLVTFMEEDKGSLRTRVLQLTTPAFTVAENPPSFTRRFVANVVATGEGEAGQYAVCSNVLVYRSRGAALPPYLFCAQRQDTLRLVDGRWRIARRLVKLDEAVLGTRNLSLFF
jgi:3-phenylpropionate/cinnamic acid dioxygenase small subunit